MNTEIIDTEDMNTQNNHTTQRERFLGMAERYFNAGLSEEEELLLKSFITHEGKDDPSFDEIRAVMGFFSVKKEKWSSRSEYRSLFGRNVFTIARIAAAAAAIAAVIFILRPKKEAAMDYISYADGRKVTDTEKVMENMEEILGGIFSESSSADIDSILDNILNK
ncbi:MAG: hypothetical protein IJV54_01915 [Bacteroidales bacterium]|nr:hypothetical protein [Bacteroidales bacterium]